MTRERDRRDEVGEVGAGRESAEYGISRGSVVRYSRGSSDDHPNHSCRCDVWEEAEGKGEENLPFALCLYSLRLYLSLAE